MPNNARPMGLWFEPANTAPATPLPVRWSWHYDAASAEYTLQEGAPNDRAAFVWDAATESYLLQPSTDGDTPEILLIAMGDSLFLIVPE